ncbi:MAG: twin-arginine translocase subunit TatC [Elusimicrobiota bacterium]
MNSDIDQPQKLTHHLEELRKRIITSVVIWIFFSIVSYHFVDPIIDWLAKPVGDFIFTSPQEAFFLRLKIALLLGVLFGLPVFIYHIWKFIGRALSIKEKSIILSILPFSYALLMAGALVAIFLVTPLAVKFLLGFSTPHLKPMISLDSYLSFIFWMVLGFGVFFQMPLVINILIRMGVVEVDTFKVYRRHIFIGIVFVSAIMTPGPDVVSQMFLAIPAYLLFELSLFFTKKN